MFLVGHIKLVKKKKKEHPPLLLPPYQFDKTRHWTELKMFPNQKTTSAIQEMAFEPEKLPDILLTRLTFVGHQGKPKRSAKFRVNTMIPESNNLIAEHIIVHIAPICPATVKLDLAVKIVRNIRPDLAAAKLKPRFQGVNNQSPIYQSDAIVWLEIDGDLDVGARLWNF